MSRLEINLKDTHFFFYKTPFFYYFQIHVFIKCHHPLELQLSVPSNITTKDMHWSVTDTVQYYNNTRGGWFHGWYAMNHHNPTFHSVSAMESESDAERGHMKMWINLNNVKIYKNISISGESFSNISWQGTFI